MISNTDIRFVNNWTLDFGACLQAPELFEYDS